jgi:hypothetical protein
MCGCNINTYYLRFFSPGPQCCIVAIGAFDYFHRTVSEIRIMGSKGIFLKLLIHINCSSCVGGERCYISLLLGRMNTFLITVCINVNK